KERRESIEPITGLPMREAIVGFSTESILEVLGGTLEPLLDAIKDGLIKGIVGMVSCTSLRDYGQDVHTVAVVKELIKRDILVLSLGCGNAAVQVAGLCSLDAVKLAGFKLQKVCNALKIPPVLSYGTCTDTGRLADLVHAISTALGGVPIPDLPVAVAAPEYMEQKATIDAIFALAYGLYTYVNPIPTVTGGTNLVKLLTKDLKDITGGLLDVEKDAVKAVDNIENHIIANRKKLGI
ncbi:MAG: carbon monoxide dehydrogenase, partial [Candidatus Heimdallarchaeota archaeon]